MAYTIDPAKELLHAFSRRAASTMVGLAAGALSPGRKVRVGAALGQIKNALDKSGKTEAGLTEKKPTVVDAGVRFTLAPRSEEWVIDEKACAQLFPRSKYPKAWRLSKKGGNVTTDIGPL